MHRYLAQLLALESATSHFKLERPIPARIFGVRWRYLGQGNLRTCPKELVGGILSGEPQSAVILAQIFNQSKKVFKIHFSSEMVHCSRFERNFVQICTMR
jgi:hypothetical protein